ncbi:MAG: cadherin domain-containing protein, partial [Rhodospirillales bacterium]|nr:cadherin domain-containing protein [Rhodospirillales bacterium]
IEVAVTDAKGVTTKQGFTITVLDVNETIPAVVSLSGGSIRENAAAGEQVATAAAKGAAGDVFRYSLSNNAGGRFAIDAQTGVITVAAGAVLDYEGATSHAIEVAVTDAKGITTKQGFTITVLDVNETIPAVVSLSGGSIRENAPAGEQVATVAAKGAAGDVFRYALSNNAGGRFAIDAQTGVITVAAGAVLDYEAATSHAIEVAVTDAKGITTKQGFSIAVLDVNETTGGLKLTHLIPENAPAGTEVGVVTPLDQVVTKPFFSLKDDAGGRFVIDADTGTVRVCEGAVLDAEESRNHSLTAVADAGSGRVVEQSFQVSLADVNEPPIALFMSAQAVDKGAAAGTLVGVASTLDQDANDTFSYALVDDAQGRFAIDAATGAISVAPNANLDPASAPSHRIIVKATDSAGHSLTNGFTLTVRTSAGTSVQPMLIDAGSTADLVDAQGRRWTADTGFAGGGIVDRGAIEIAGTTNDRLYQTERWGMTGYSLPVSPGLYTVKLHFAETYATAPGARIFSVDVEGQKLTDIDLVAAAGARTAMVRSVPNVAVSDGKLDIGFTAKAGAAVINAIEVEPAQAQ